MVWKFKCRDGRQRRRPLIRQSAGRCEGKFVRPIEGRFEEPFEDFLKGGLKSHLKGSMKGSLKDMPGQLPEKEVA